MSYGEYEKYLGCNGILYVSDAPGFLSLLRFLLRTSRIFYTYKMQLLRLVRVFRLRRIMTRARTQLRAICRTYRREHRDRGVVRGTTCSFTNASPRQEYMMSLTDRGYFSP